MRPSRFILASMLVFGGFFQSCASPEEARRIAFGPAPAVSLGGSSHSELDILLGERQATSPQARDPACGAITDCNPDATTDCSLVSKALSNLGFGAAGTAGYGAGGALGAAAGAGPSEEGGAGGIAGAAGQAGLATAGSALTGGAGEIIPPKFDAMTPPATHACQVQQVGEKVMATCGLAGPGGPDNPCMSSKDCGAGLACVGESALARCRPYCCGGTSVCASGSYCAKLPLRDDMAADSSISVPVCVPADNCELSEPFPCPSDRLCSCTAGHACSVVRPDGTTSCVMPGHGLEGQACPCAPGHLCAQGSQKCMKLCRTTDVGACGAGRCQTAGSLPPNYGVCVGAPASTAGAAGEAGQASE